MNILRFIQSSVDDDQNDDRTFSFRWTVSLRYEASGRWSSFLLLLVKSEFSSLSQTLFCCLRPDIIQEGIFPLCVAKKTGPRTRPEQTDREERRGGAEGWALRDGEEQQINGDQQNRHQWSWKTDAPRIRVDWIPRVLFEV